MSAAQTTTTNHGAAIPLPAIRACWKPAGADFTHAKCGGGSIIYRVVNDDHDDHQYKCLRCGDTWYVDGPDA